MQKMNTYLFNIYIYSILTILLFGCSSVSLVEPGKSSPQMSFIDIAKFDRDMTASLSDKYDSIQVDFYNKVNPNSLPDRLQNWLSAVEKNGGKVEIKRPEGELASKDPFSLISLASTLYSNLKAKANAAFEKNYDSAKGRNAVIQLERNKDGDVVVSKISFIKKP